MEKHQQLFAIAQLIASERPTFFMRKGPGVGDRDTNAFMAELRRRARAAFGVDYAEKTICGPGNALRVDYFFPDEQTIVEVALGLRNPLSEFERDILKALMAVEAGHPVAQLVLISKPGAEKRLAQPGARAIAAWVEQKHGLKVVVRELAADRNDLIDGDRVGPRPI